jgi:hypothetical protein
MILACALGRIRSMSYVSASGKASRAMEAVPKIVRAALVGR